MPADGQARSRTFTVERDGVRRTFVMESAPRWPEYRKTATVRAIPMTAPFEVETLEGTMRGEVGDYLCVGPAGDIWPVKKEIFEATYARVEGSS